MAGDGNGKKAAKAVVSAKPPKAAVTPRKKPAADKRVATVSAKSQQQPVVVQYSTLQEDTPPVCQEEHVVMHLRSTKSCRSRSDEMPTVMEDDDDDDDDEEADEADEKPIDDPFPVPPPGRSVGAGNDGNGGNLCYWCCHSSEQGMVSMPLRRDTDGTIHGIGAFCGLSCAAAFNFSSHEFGQHPWKTFQLLNHLHLSAGGDGPLPIAPSRLLLRCFGGSMDMAAFRMTTGPCSAITHPVVPHVPEHRSKVVQAIVQASDSLLRTKASIMGSLKIRRSKGGNEA
jgi:hypothetical protein